MESKRDSQRIDSTSHAMEFKAKLGGETRAFVLTMSIQSRDNPRMDLTLEDVENLTYLNVLRLESGAYQNLAKSETIHVSMFDFPAFLSQFSAQSSRIDVTDNTLRFWTSSALKDTCSLQLRMAEASALQKVDHLAAKLRMFIDKHGQSSGDLTAVRAQLAACEQLRAELVEKLRQANNDADERVHREHEAGTRRQELALDDQARKHAQREAQLQNDKVQCERQLQAKNDQLGGENKALQQHCTAIERKLAETSAELRTTTAERDSEAKAAAELRTQLNAAKAKIAQLESRETTLSEQNLAIARLQGEIKNSQQHVANLEKQIRQHVELADALKEAEKKHKDEARALAEKYTVAVARLTASEKAVGDGDAAMAMLKEKLKLKMQKIKAVKGEAARVVAERDTAVTALEGAKRTLTATEARATDLDTALKSAMDKLEAQKQALLDKDSHIVTLNGQLNSKELGGGTAFDYTPGSYVAGQATGISGLGSTAFTYMSSQPLQRPRSPPAEQSRTTAVGGGLSPTSAAALAAAAGTTDDGRGVPYSASKPAAAETDFSRYRSTISTATTGSAATGFQGMSLPYRDFAALPVTLSPPSHRGGASYAPSADVLASGNGGTSAYYGVGGARVSTAAASGPRDVLSNVTNVGTNGHGGRSSAKPASTADRYSSAGGKSAYFS